MFTKKKSFAASWYKNHLIRCIIFVIFIKLFNSGKRCRADFKGCPKSQQTKEKCQNRERTDLHMSESVEK